MCWDPISRTHTHTHTPTHLFFFLFLFLRSDSHRTKSVGRSRVAVASQAGRWKNGINPEAQGLERPQSQHLRKSQSQQNNPQRQNAPPKHPAIQHQGTGAQQEGPAHPTSTMQSSRQGSPAHQKRPDSSLGCRKPKPPPQHCSSSSECDASRPKGSWW